MLQKQAYSTESDPPKDIHCESMYTQDDKTFGGIGGYVPIIGTNFGNMEKNNSVHVVKIRNDWIYL